MISTQISQILSWGISNFIIITNPEFDHLIKEDIKVITQKLTLIL